MISRSFVFDKIESKAKISEFETDYKKVNGSDLLFFAVANFAPNFRQKVLLVMSKSGSNYGKNMGDICQESFWKSKVGGDIFGEIHP